MAVIDWHYPYEVRFGSRWYFAEMQYRIADLKVLVNFKTILIVGSGRSFTENLFLKDRFVIASDRSAELLNVAKKHAVNTHFFLACNGFKLPFKNQSFACVYSQALLEHFNLSEATRLLKEIGVGRTRVSPLGWTAKKVNRWEQSTIGNPRSG